MTMQPFLMMIRSSLAIGMLALCGIAQAGTVSHTYTVDSHAAPWDPAVNPNFHFGVGDNIGPTIVSGLQGFDFNTGDVLNITYFGGLTSAFGGVPVVDGNGYVGSPFRNDDPGSSGTGFPSQYMDFSTNDIFLQALVGTFTDSSGVIVGSPFAINNALSIAVPNGASQLQLGFNDDIFADNTGALDVNVSGPGTSVPEPSSFALLSLGGIGLAIRVYRRRRDGTTV